MEEAVGGWVEASIRPGKRVLDIPEMCVHGRLSKLKDKQNVMNYTLSF